MINAKDERKEIQKYIYFTWEVRMIDCRKKDPE